MSILISILLNGCLIIFTSVYLTGFLWNEDLPFQEYGTLNRIFKNFSTN
jgi:hypothetical protein